MASVCKPRIGIYAPGVKGMDDLPNHRSALYRYWGDLVPAIRDAGYEVVFFPGHPESRGTDGESHVVSKSPPSHTPVRSRSVLNLIPQCLRFAVGMTRDCLRLRRMFRTARCDLLHTSFMGCEVSGIAGRLAGIRYIVGTYHTLPLEKYSIAPRVQRFVEWLYAHSLHAAIANAHNTQAMWENRCPCLKTKFRTIHHGFNPDEYLREALPPATRQEFGLPSDDFLLAVPARIHPMKGIPYLIDALAAIRARHPTAAVVLFGNKEQAPELASQISQLGLDHAVHFVGWRKDVLRVVSACDVVVLPSIHTETFGRALAEGMILGKPCVATRVGGMPEVVEDGVTGFIVPPRDSTALAQAICRLLGDSDLRRRFGQAGRTRIEKHFSVQQMQKKTLAVYGELLRNCEVSR
jgi:glycosyltransferase involved in cell wall biosynthesis